MFKTDDILGNHSPLHFSTLATGFGTVDADGYGLNYIPSSDGSRITFGIESKRASVVSNTKKFAESISQALGQMQAMCEDAAQSMAIQKPSL